MLNEKSCMLVIPKKLLTEYQGRCSNRQCRRKIFWGGLVMSSCDGTNTRVRVDSELSEEFDVKVGMHLGSMLSILLLHF